ncbi:MAG: hypothetical protein KAR54_03340 [Candidatus Pacebacteria bacterium]|nr:hypothetical protein [Candidatus Paceibacterota bacterium]
MKTNILILIAFILGVVFGINIAIRSTIIPIDKIVKTLSHDFVMNLTATVFQSVFVIIIITLILKATWWFCEQV